MTKKNINVSIVIFLKEINEFGFKVWVQTREEQGLLYGKQEFPGGKIEAGETDAQAARREVLEEVGIEIPSHSSLIFFKEQHYTTEIKNICLNVFLSNYDLLPIEKGQWLGLTFDKKSAHLEGIIPPINHIILDELAVYILFHFQRGITEQLWQI